MNNQDLKSHVGISDNKNKVIRNHLIIFMKANEGNYQKNDVFRELASINSQINLLNLLEKHRVQHTFHLSNELNQTPESILERAQQSIDQTPKKQLLKDMIKCCSKEEMGKTTFYTLLNEDQELKRLWKLRSDFNKRMDSSSKPRSKNTQKQSRKELEKRIQILIEENTSLTRENKELKARVQELGDKLNKILLLCSNPVSDVSSMKVDDQSIPTTSEPLSCISYPDNVSLQEGIS